MSVHITAAVATAPATAPTAGHLLLLLLLVCRSHCWSSTAPTTARVLLLVCCSCTAPTTARVLLLLLLACCSYCCFYCWSFADCPMIVYCYCYCSCCKGQKVMGCARSALCRSISRIRFWISSLISKFRGTFRNARIPRSRLRAGFRQLTLVPSRLQAGFNFLNAGFIFMLIIM